MLTKPYRPTHLRAQHRQVSLGYYAPNLVAAFSTLLLLATGTVIAGAIFLGKQYHTATAVAKDACNRTISLTVSGKTYTASPQEVCSWLTSSPEHMQNRRIVQVNTPDFDSAAISSWLQQVQAKVEVPPRNGIREIDSAGNLVRLLADPVSGTKITGLATVPSALEILLEQSPPAATLQEKPIPEVAISSVGRNIEVNLQTEATPARWDETEVPAAPLVYQAADSEKWIDINLVNQTITCYQGKQIELGPFPMVDGHPNSPTVTGTFQVSWKLAEQLMEGQGWDGPYSELSPWVIYFHGPYAIHGAPWRNTFTNQPDVGSHGCINMDSDQAKLIYDWATHGTTVISH